MCRSDNIQHVLKILAKNAVDSIRPDLMESVDIADKLNISLAETKQLLWGMRGMGIIECSMEVDYSLITQQGFKQMSC
ncbi:MAG: hypothetical protein BA866_10875 [Desulfobulbaceae bacterium S5133MH15]|nr:MAG: hypothetical protein BA866_10875 [Desulfobulbaceae bacterium S5133MH15]